jgi:hypothetical protein
MSGKSKQSGDPQIARRTMFHVRKLQLITHAPEACRELESLLQTSESIACAYKFVQRIYAVHDKRYLKAAHARKRVLKAWAALPDELKQHFKKYETALFKRGTEYFANWTKGATSNGVTEAMNRALRDIYRAGRGLRFEELRLRAVYSASPTELASRRKYGELGPIESARAMINGASIPGPVRTVNRHGLHKRGSRPWKTSPKQMDLFR